MKPPPPPRQRAAAARGTRHAAAPIGKSAFEPTDPVSDVLRDLRLDQATYCRAELSAPWGLEMSFQDGVRMHFVVEGRCWLRSAAMAPLPLQEGDVILLPHGSAHVIADAAASNAISLAAARPTPLGDGTYQLSLGGGGERALIVCCTIGFSGPASHPLVAMLPASLHIQRGRGADRRLATLLDLMADEVAQQRIGAATVMARLADIILTRIVRDWIESRGEELAGWLAAVKDPQIGKALAAIHRSPGERWTIERLAATAHLARASFSRRFGELLGMSPGRYLLAWRMRLATIWLRAESLTLSQMAERLGYESDTSFSRAYRRSTGQAPGAVRRSQA